jgi:hypothetical protein
MSTVFWDITLCSPLKVYWRFEGKYHFHLQGWISQARYQSERRWHAFTLVSCLAYLTLKMEVICSSKTSVDLQWTTRRYIPEDSTLQTYDRLRKTLEMLLLCIHLWHLCKKCKFVHWSSYWETDWTWNFTPWSPTQSIWVISEEYLWPSTVFI